ADLIGAQRAAAAGVLRPAEYSGLEEGSVHDQLPPALEQVEQDDFALGSLELVLLLHRRPWHPSTLGGQRVTRARQRLLFYQELLPRSFPFLLRHDWGCLHRDMLCLVSFFAHCHHLLNLSQDDFLKPLAPKIFSALDRCTQQSLPWIQLRLPSLPAMLQQNGGGLRRFILLRYQSPDHGSPDSPDPPSRIAAWRYFL